MAEDQPVVSWGGPAVLAGYDLHVRAAYPDGEALHQDRSEAGVGLGDLVELGGVLRPGTTVIGFHARSGVRAGW